jgi:DHA2 family multidrug resistance protein-like MFS transporter
MTETTTPDAKATRREWIGLAVIALPCALYAMDLTVLNLAVPQLSRNLQPSASQLLWIIDIYGFMVAGWLITMGTLGDRIGRRKLLMFGAAAFAVASLIAAFSTGAEMLIATRALLGLAGATVAPSTLSLIRNMFHDPRERTVAISIWITSYSVGGAIGPLVGGIMLERFWWGSVFLLAVPVMLLVIALAPILLPEYRDPNAGRADPISAAMSLAAILLAVYGFKRIAEDGVGNVAMSSIVAGIVVGVLFVRRQQRLSDPLIDIRLFQSRMFSAALSIYLLAGIAAFGVYIFIAQYLQLVLGLSPLRAGLWTIPWSIGFIVGTLLVPNLVRRFERSSVMGGGLLLAAVGFFVILWVDGTAGLPAIVIGSILFSIGLSPVFTLTTDIIIGSAPPERAGAAAAISETSGELGGVLGIAIMGSIGTAVYRAAMANAPEAARGTLGGALATADTMPREAAAALTALAQDSFVEAMRVTTMIEIAIIFIMAAMAFTLLRRTRTPRTVGAASQIAALP